jgi:Zn-dependent membrane protease YugP
MFGFFDPLYLLLLSPALLLMLWAQRKVKSSFAHGMRVGTSLSGAEAARRILDDAGCGTVDIEQVRGTLTDHYDPRHKVLRLSRDVYQSRTASAVGIAAHEAGHALQDAHNYGPLVVRNAAVPAARVGPTASIILLILGGLMHSAPLVIFGLVAFACLVFFQLVNLPVEFDASNRAKRLLQDMQIVDQHGAAAVNSVLNAAAWTYVAATLQSILTLLYYVLRFGGVLRSDD